MQSVGTSNTQQAKTINEFARDWRLGRTSVYALAKAGKLKLTKIGRATRVLAEDERSFAASLRRTSTDT